MDDLNLSEPVACTFSDADQRKETRHFKSALTPHILPRRLLDNGVQLTFAPAPGVRESLDELVRLDQQCCTFLDHHVKEDEKTVTLIVRSHGQGIAFAQEFFSELADADNPKQQGDL